MTSRLVGMRYRIFRAVARWSITRPWTVVMVAVISAAASLVYTSLKLEFRTGQDDLVTANSRDSRNYLRYSKEFPDLDGLIIAVSTTPDRLRAEHFADTLADRLTRDRVNVKSVLYRIDPETTASHALLYLDRAELEQMSARVRDYAPLMAGYAAKPTLENLFGVASAGLAATAASGGAQAESGGGGEMMKRTLRGIGASSESEFESPFAGLAQSSGGNAALRDGFIASDNGKYLLLDVAPADGAPGGADPVAVIQGRLDQLRGEFPGVEAGMTGGPALAWTEAQSTAHDIALASALAVASNALLLIVPFGALLKPLFALAALLIGVAWSFGFTTLFIGHLNLLSAVFTSVLAGIGINFPIHLMARYEEARRHGEHVGKSLELAVVNTGTGVTASALIMALAFLSPCFSDFKGISELGIVSAAGLFLCLISAITIFPALVAIQDRGHPPLPMPLVPMKPSLLRRTAGIFRRPWTIVIVSSAITAAALIAVRGVSFDQNLLKLQAQDTEAVRFEGKLLKDSGRSSWFAVAMAPNMNEADQKAAAFKRIPEVSDAETISSYVPEAQPEKLATLSRLKPLLDQIRFKPAPGSSDYRQLRGELEKMAFAFKSMGGGDAETAQLFDKAIARIDSDPAGVARYERQMAQDFARKLDVFRQNVAGGEVRAESLPEVLRTRFVGKSGSYLVQIYPRGDIWADVPLKRFVRATRTVDRDVTGPPIQTYSIASVMRIGYERAAVIALVAVFLFVFADFRNLRDTALATVPLIFGSAWLLEAMGLAGMRFNLANLFAVPIIIGMAVDNGVNLVYRWREERDKTSLILSKAVGKSVTICSLTTIAGFAALIPATHHGISSLGVILSIGVGFILLATLLVAPALFLIAGRRVKQRDQNSAGAAGSSVRRAAAGAIALGLTLGVARAALAQQPTAHSQLLSHEGDNLLVRTFVREAEEMIQRALGRDPLDTSEIQAAIQKLKDAQAIAPSDDSICVDLGFAYALLKEVGLSVDMYRKAVDLNPSPANFKELATVYLRTGEADKSLMAANAGLAKDPRNAGLYNARGMAMHDMTRFHEAEKDFRRAIELDPNLAVARENLKALSDEANTRRTSIAKPSTATKAAEEVKTLPSAERPPMAPQDILPPPADLAPP